MDRTDKEGRKSTEKEGGKYPENRRETRYPAIPDSVRQEGLVQDSAASESWSSDAGQKRDRRQGKYTIQDYQALEKSKISGCRGQGVLDRGS